MNNTRRIKSFIGAMTLAALCAATYASLISRALHPYLALAILGLATATSRMKVKLPGINGNMSMNLPFLLTAVITLSSAEAMFIACVSTAVQCWPKKNAKINTQQIAFNLSMMVFATAVASLMSHTELLKRTHLNGSALGLMVAATALFVGQTVPVAGIVAVSERKSVSSIWWELSQLSFPYYVLSAGVTSMVQTVGVHLGWGLALAVFPVMYGVHRSYQVYFSRMTQSTRTEVLVRAAGAGA